MIADIRTVDPYKKIIFTISPVKHLRDGIMENAVSKARLLSALYTALEFRPDCRYFPAFEIVTEELRDHSFYEADLAHPNEWTRHYIFSKFMESMFDENSKAYIEARSELLKMQSHRVLSENPAEIEKWNLSIEKSRKALESTFGIHLES